MLSGRTGPELMPVDLARWRRQPGAAATQPDWLWRFQAAESGPEVAVVAIVHGNELCGALALDRLLRDGLRPRRGGLTLCFANMAAYRRFDPADPTDARFVDEDMNRLWAPETLACDRLSLELARARVLWPWLERADVLLDLHSMQGAGGPLMLTGLSRRAAALARDCRLPDWIVADAGHAAGRRLIDHPRFADPAGGATALLAECGPHGRRETLSVALDVVARVLCTVGSIDPADAAAYLPPGGRPPLGYIQMTEAVTAATDRFVFLEDFQGLEIVRRGGTPIARDGDREIATPYDDCMLVMPVHRLRRGQTAVRLGRVVP